MERYRLPLAAKGSGGEGPAASLCAAN
jgi:hypothetical protein